MNQYYLLIKIIKKISNKYYIIELINNECLRKKNQHLKQKQLKTCSSP